MGLFRRRKKKQSTRSDSTPSSESYSFGRTHELGSNSRQKDSVNPLDTESDTSSVLSKPVLPTPEKHDTWHVDKNNPRLQSIQSELKRLELQIPKAKNNISKRGAGGELGDWFSTNNLRNIK